jgi:YVTN family beta-propeller protein
VSIEGQTNAHIGSYVLGEVVGRGGMGVVYRATHVHLGREVALKLLAPQLSGNDEFRHRFLRESRLAASIEHPNVITVYDAGDFNGTLYIAMRYVEGIDLAQLLREKGPLEPLAAVSLLDQVAAALDAAHERGLVHRDVKPANVMIASGRCYLTDFGLTKQAAAGATTLALTRTGSFLGTLNYAAPEQIEGREITAQTDIYALGCVLHECLTGSPPFTKDSEVALLYAHLSEPPPPPSQLRSDLPVAIDPVVAKALAKKPEERYRTCGELMSAARAALTEGAGQAAAQPPAPPTAAAQPPRVAAQPPTGSPPRSREEADTGILPGTAATARGQAAPPTAQYAAGGGGTEVTEPGAPIAPPGPRGSRRLALLLAAGVAVVAAAILVVVAAGGGSGNQTRALARGAILVGNSPDGVAHPVGAARRGTVWVANAGDGTITQINEATGRVTGNQFTYASRSGRAAPLSFWQGALWVGDSSNGSVDQIDPTTGHVMRRIHVGGQPYATTVVGAGAAGSGSLWVANYNGTIAKILPGNGSAPPSRRVFAAASGPKRMTEVGKTLVVANETEGTVTKIDTTTGGVIGTLQVHMHPAAISAVPGSDSLWLADRSQDTVTQFAIDSGKMIGSPIHVGSGPSRMTLSTNMLWVANSGDGTVTRIDLSTDRPLAPIKVGGYPDAITASDGIVWVAVWSRPNPQYQGPPGGVTRIAEDTGQVLPHS